MGALGSLEFRRPARTQKRYDESDWLKAPCRVRLDFVDRTWQPSDNELPAFGNPPQDFT